MYPQYKKIIFLNGELEASEVSREGENFRNFRLRS
jgi:hypothetical protein